MSEKTINPNKVLAYIEAGLSIPPEPKQFRKVAIAPFLLVMLVGTIPGVVLGNYWLLLSLIMIVSSIALTIIVFILSKKQLTIMNRLKMQALIYSNWILQIILIQTMFYTMAYGFNLMLILIYLVPVLTPFGMGLKNTKRLRSSCTISSKNSSRLLLPFSCTGIIGIFIGKNFFQNASQEFAIVFVILSFTVISCFLSIGLLAYQRIYYLKKYVNQ